MKKKISKEKVKNNKNMNLVNDNNAITLIALVITIIVLLILTGVTINLTLGENGIFKTAEMAGKNYTEAQEQELAGIANFNNEINNIIGGLGNNSNGNGGSGGETGNLPSTAETSPFLPDSNSTVIEDDLDKGVVVQDSKNNEWTWIVVPKSVTANSITDGDIENALIGYATKYREDFSDTWYEGCGLSQSKYEENYSKMLQSIKANGGFYIGKYEVGSFDNPVTSSDNTRQAVIQQGAYPYNYVTCSQAEEIAEGLATGGKTSTLMFGIQWDLVLAYLESKGVPAADLNDDSSSWGNYANNSFPVAEGNKYAIYNQSTSQLGEWNPVPSDYEKPNSGTESMVLLSTGAVEDNSKMNIYDLAGNVYEWTLEKSTRTDYPGAIRGGRYYSNGSRNPASHRNNYSTSDSGDSVGFRPALY